MSAETIAARLRADEDALRRFKSYGTVDGRELRPEVAAEVELLLTDEPLKFEWSHHLAASEAAEVEWVMRGLLARRAVALLYSRPKCGKSTLIGGLLAALEDESVDRFIGREVPRESTRTVLLAEEGAATLKSKLPPNVRVLCRDSAFPKPAWTDLLDGAAAEAERIGAAIVVIDTFRFWGGLAGDDEKSSGPVQPLIDKAAEVASAFGVAVLIVHHSRKSGGDDGDAASGSNAITGGVDIVLELDRVGESAPNQRSIIGLSRFPDTPGALTFEWEKSTGKFTPIGEAETRQEGKQQALAASVLGALEGADEPMTRADLEDEIGVAWKQILGALRLLMKASKVERSGEGKAGSPYRFKSVQHRHAQTSTDMESGVCVPRRGNTPRPESVQEVAQTPDDEAKAERLIAKYGEGF